METQIAIIFTTFLRDELAQRTIESILKYWKPEYQLFIGDQTPTVSKAQKYSDFFYYSLPYNCGLSYARNYLISKAYSLGIPYIFMTADSIAFTQNYNLSPMISLLNSDKKIAKIGFNLKNRIPWEFNLDLKKSFELSVSHKYITYCDINFQKVDICRNFFLGKTEAFMDVPYDNSLMMAEHEDHSWRLKQANYETYYTNKIYGNYIDSKPTEYKTFRDSAMKECKKKLLEKYKIQGWVNYSPEVQAIFHEWRNGKCI